MYLVIKLELPKRKSTRLKNYDYSSEGAYFITICTQSHKKIFSNIVGAIHESPENKLNHYGKILDFYIQELNARFDLRIDKYIIMPNHIHLIAVIENNERAIRESPLRFLELKIIVFSPKKYNFISRNILLKN